MRILFSILLLISYSANSITPQLLMKSSVFMNNDKTYYIETNYRILNSSLNFIRTKNKTFQATYLIQLSITNNKGERVKYFDFNLYSPQIKDTSLAYFDLIDLKRVCVPSGNYKVNLKVTDINSLDSTIQSEVVSVYFPNTTVSISDPLFIESFSSSTESNIFSRLGYDLIPYPISYFPSSVTYINLYQEIYNSDKILKNGKISIKTSIKNLYQKEEELISKEEKQSTDSVNYLFTTLDISKLGSGSYQLLTEVLINDSVIANHRDIFLRILKKKIAYDSIENISSHNLFSEKINPDSLFFYLKSLKILADENENTIINILIDKQDFIKTKKFFYLFWNQRAEGFEEQAWLDYKKDVDAVEYDFATPIRHGFETDRGRIYLLYGEPNQRDASSSEPSANPYEVWKYYQFNERQNNVFFIFCDEDLATNDYKLIHSNARGEVYDVRWKFRIYRNFNERNGSQDFDITDFNSQVGNRIETIINR